jgi:hypothetical protein
MTQQSHFSKRDGFRASERRRIPADAEDAAGKCNEEVNFRLQPSSLWEKAEEATFGENPEQFQTRQA